MPEFPNSRLIILRQLLNHTSGTEDFTHRTPFGEAQASNPNAVWSPKRSLRYAQHPDSKPGMEWAYSNTYYILAGLVSKRATRSTVAHELHRRLLRRPEFGRIVLQGDERPRGSVAVGYQDLDGDSELERTPNNGYVPSTPEATAVWTAGGMLATAEDLARAGDGIFRVLCSPTHRGTR